MWDLFKRLHKIQETLSIGELLPSCSFTAIGNLPCCPQGPFTSTTSFPLKRDGGFHLNFSIKRN